MGLIPLFIAAFSLFAMPLQAQDIPVFTPSDEGRPFIDVYATGLYSATCVQGAGCTCAALGVNREELAVILGENAIDANILGLVDSPAVGEDLTAETPDALHARYGGQGYCLQTPLEPKDGLWQDGRPQNVNVQCGQGTAMFQQVLTNQKSVTARINWQGRFSGETIQSAFIAADPDPENTPHSFTDLTPVETLGIASLADEGGTMTSKGRIRLVTPTLFSVDWQVQGQTETGPCNWSYTLPAKWIGE